MRFLFIVLASWLVVSCTDDGRDLPVPQESLSIGGPLYLISTSYTGGNFKTGEDDEHDDPWNTIRNKFDLDAIPPGKSGGNEGVLLGGHLRASYLFAGTDTWKDGGGHDDPWTTIRENFGRDTLYDGESEASKEGEDDDPWNSILDRLSDGSFTTNRLGSGSGEDVPWSTIEEDSPIDEFDTERSAFIPTKGRGGSWEHDDPWTTIESRGQGSDGDSCKSDVTGNEKANDGYNDPWETITEYGQQRILMKDNEVPKRSVKSDDTGKEVSWNESDESLPNGPIVAKPNSKTPGKWKYQAIFLMIGNTLTDAIGTGYVKEVRGGVAMVALSSGKSVFVMQCPRSWRLGTYVQFEGLDAG